MIELIHPILAHFVFPLLFIILILEFLSLMKIAKNVNHTSAIILIVISVFSIASYYTGFEEYSERLELLDKEKTYIETHQLIAKIYLLSIFPTFIFAMIRICGSFKYIDYLYIVFLLISVFFAGYVSHLGGKLVYNHAIGVHPESNL